MTHRTTTFLCVDCEFDTLKGCEYYMVRDAIWAESGMEDGMLCVGCLEIRLERVLTPGDFTQFPINSLNRGHSKRLLSRLSGGT